MTDPASNGKAFPISPRPHALLLVKGLDAGGAERTIVSQVSGRQRSAFTYTVGYVAADHDRWASQVEAAGADVLALGSRANWDLRWPFRLRRFILDEQIAIVHTHSPYVAAIARLVLATIPRERRPPHVYTEHNLWDSYHLLTRLANRLTYSRDAHTFAVSDAVRKSVNSRFRKSVETITLGVDRERIDRTRAFRQDVRNSLGISDNEILVGTVANLRPQKALHDLLAAAHKVSAASEHLDIKFVCVGGGALERELCELRDALGLDGVFEFLGTSDDAVVVMSAFDIFALTSVREGKPVALMESLSMGLPIVATTVGGVPEMISNGIEGFLVPESNPEAVAEAILTLARGKQLRVEMGAAALRRAVFFDASAAAQSIENRYQALLSDQSKEK